MENLYIKSKKLYVDSKFNAVKRMLLSKNYKSQYTNSFIDIKFSNYDFMLNDILNLDICIRKKDKLLDKRIKTIEENIREVINDFNFEQYESPTKGFLS